MPLDLDMASMEVAQRRPSRLVATATRTCVAPALLYMAAFALLDPDAIRHFTTHFWADTGDGMQGVWNLWWFPHAVVDLRTNPWWTDYLHHPHGAPLIVHNLVEANGVLAVLLRPFSSQVATHNTIIFLSFWGSGLTTFWLAMHVTAGRWWPSWVAGFVYGFSNHHFMNAEGLLHMLTMQWLPLFLLLWLRLLERPSIARGIGVGLVLLLNLLSAPYFFLYAVLMGALLLLDHAVAARDWRAVLRRDMLGALVALTLTTLATAGPWIGALLLTSRADPFLWTHDAREYPMDLLAPFIPAAHWRFAELTELYWRHLEGNVNTTSVHLGLSVIAMLAWLFWRRREVAPSRWRPFFLLGAVFGVLALGPSLTYWGLPVTPAIMPYAWLEVLVPPLSMGGMPVRMAVVCQLAAAVLVAVALAHARVRSTRARLALAALLGLMVVEYLPAPLPLTTAEVPGYVTALRELPRRGGVVEHYRGNHRPLYHQTVHGHPLVGGYLSRVGANTYRRSQELLFAAGRQDDAVLCAGQVAYVVLPTDRARFQGPHHIERYRDADRRIVELDCDAIGTASSNDGGQR